MKKKNKSKREKTLTAVGAVVAAGLTPGIIAATPVNDPNAGLTAAEVVAIDGNAYSFDELYAMQQRAIRKVEPQVATRYGVPPSQQSRLYGVPRPKPPKRPTPPQTKQPIILKDTIQRYLIYYCAQLIDADTEGILISLDSDLTRELEMNEDQLKELAAEIKERYGVEVSYHRFCLIGQLNTLRLVSEYIYRLKTVWDK